MNRKEVERLARHVERVAPKCRIECHYYPHEGYALSIESECPWWWFLCYQIAHWNDRHPSNSVSQDDFEPGGFLAENSSARRKIARTIPLNRKAIRSYIARSNQGNQERFALILLVASSGGRAKLRWIGAANAANASFWDTFDSEDYYCAFLPSVYPLDSDQEEIDAMDTIQRHASATDQVEAKRLRRETGASWTTLADKFCSQAWLDSKLGQGEKLAERWINALNSEPPRGATHDPLWSRNPNEPHHGDPLRPPVKFRWGKNGLK